MICGAAHNESLAEMAAHLKHPTTDPFRLHGLSRMAGETGVWARAGDWCERVGFPFGSPYPHPGLRSVSPRGRDTFAIRFIADGDHCVLYMPCFAPRPGLSLPVTLCSSSFPVLLMPPCWPCCGRLRRVRPNVECHVGYDIAMPTHRGLPTLIRTEAGCFS